MWNIRRTLSLAAVLGLIAVTVTCSDEFPGAPEEGADARFDVTIEPVRWVDQLVIGDAATLEVQVVDEAGRVVTDAAVEWDIPIELSAPSDDRLTKEVTGAELAQDVVVEVSIADTERFKEAMYADTIAVLLGGVRIGRPAADTTLTAFGDTTVIEARGLDVGGNPVQGATLTWNSGDLAALEAVDIQGESLRVASQASGVDEVIVSHALCSGTCADTVAITVDQVVDSVATTVGRDSLISGDVVTASAGGVDRNDFDVADAVFTWTSRDEAVVTVDASGDITGVAVGTAYVVAEAPSGATDSVWVEVLPSGDMVVAVTDAPAEYYENAWLYLAGAYIQDDIVMDGPRWLMQGARAVDLLTLQGGLLDTLGIDNVPLNNYSQIHLVLDSAAVELEAGYTFGDGSTRWVMVPSPTPDTITATISSGAAVTDGGQVEVVVEFDVNQNFPLDGEPDTGTVVGDASFSARPRSIEKTASGNIDGTLSNTDTLTVGGRLIRAVRTDVAGDTVTTRSATDGSFGLYYLSPGDYDVTLLSTFACYRPNPLSRSVGVTAGGTTTGTDFSLDLVIPDSVVVTTPQGTVNAIGDTVQLTAAVYENDIEVQGVRIGWGTVDAALMTVDRDGQAISQGVGTAQVYAEVCGVADTIPIQVQQVPAQLRVTPAPVAVDVGDTVHVNVEVVDSNAVAIPGQTVTYQVTDEAIATVDVDGVVTGVSGGITTLTVTGGGLTRDVSVQVVIPGLRFDYLTAGGNSSCDINGSGAAYCWGYNGDGQLGDGTYDETYSPVAVGGGYNFASVDMSASNDHACGVTITGAGYCWGRGWNGQLGDGAFTTSETPVLVSGSHAWIQIEVGDEFSCGLTAGGETYCWGASWNGRLGNNGATGNVGTPTLVDGGHTFVELDLGQGHACGVDDTGKVYCWGQGGRGQIGDDLWQDTPQPSQALSSVTFTSVALGVEHSCAVDTDGNAYCWGRNEQNQLGAGNFNDQPRPIVVAGLLKYAHLAAGQYHTCGILQDGRTACWGGNWNGQLGDGTVDNASAPVIVDTNLVFTYLDAGFTHTCGQTEFGETYCWGYNGNGQLGNGLTSRVAEAVDVGAPFKVLDGGLALGEHSHVCVLATDGTPYCTGANYAYQLGDGTTTNSATWVAVQTAETFVKISTGGTHSCGLTDTGDIYCWGQGWAGQVGQGAYEDAPTPALVAGGYTWVDVSAGGDRFSCGVTDAGELYCWGRNQESQAGQSDTNQNYSSPTLVDNSMTWTKVATGLKYACAINDAGAAYCWGSDKDWGDQSWGSLGGDNWGWWNVVPPEPVSGGYVFTSITVGRTHGCGIADTGAGYCWGKGDNGQLGHGNFWSEGAPVRVGAIFFNRMRTGNEHTCSITDGGDAACWGANWNGQLGNTTYDNSASPVLVTAPESLVDIDAGSDMACGVGATDGTLYCWGSRGSQGLFGDGGKSQYTEPVATVLH